MSTPGFSVQQCSFRTRLTVMIILLSFSLLSAGAVAQLTVANASSYAMAPETFAQGSYQYNSDGRSCCTVGTQYSPEYCTDPNSILKADEYITACCIDGNNYIVHYANVADIPTHIPLSKSDTVSVPYDDTSIDVTYNITGVYMDHVTLYANATLIVLYNTNKLMQESTMEIQLARAYADSGVFDFEIAPVLGSVIVNMQTRVSDNGTIGIRADIIGTSVLAEVFDSVHFEQNIYVDELKLLVSIFKLCDEPSLEECAWLGTAPFCDGECPAEGGWTLKREDRYGDGD